MLKGIGHRAAEVRIPASASELKIPEHAEMVWDDGRHIVEPVLDEWTPTVSKLKALCWFVGGFGFFYGIYQGAKFFSSEKELVGRVVAAESPLAPSAAESHH